MKHLLHRKMTYNILLTYIRPIDWKAANTQYIIRGVDETNNIE